MTIKQRIKRVTKEWLIYGMLLITAMALIFPLVYMLTNSLMASQEVLRTYGGLTSAQMDAPQNITFKLIPDEVTFIQYYHVLFRKPAFLVMFWNSVALVVPIVFGQVMVGSLAAFALVN